VNHTRLSNDRLSDWGESRIESTPERSAPGAAPLVTNRWPATAGQEGAFSIGQRRARTAAAQVDPNKQPRHAGFTSILETWSRPNWLPR
jgi:hypothetical protein